MKNVIVAGVAALALVGCGSKEEVAAPEAAPAETAVAPEASVEVPADAQVAVGEVSSSEPAKEPTVVYPAEAAK
jgi:uncharacterized protein YcfL